MMMSSLLHYYNLGIPADRVLYELTYPQMYHLMDKISKEKEKEIKENKNDTPQTHGSVTVVKNFADMWR